MAGENIKLVDKQLNTNWAEKWLNQITLLIERYKLDWIILWTAIITIMLFLKFLSNQTIPNSELNFVFF